MSPHASTQQSVTLHRWTYFIRSIDRNVKGGIHSLIINDGRHAKKLIKKHLSHLTFNFQFITDFICNER